MTEKECPWDTRSVHGRFFLDLVNRVEALEAKPRFVPPTDLEGLRTAIDRVNRHFETVVADSDDEEAWAYIRALVEGACGLGPFAKEPK